MLKFETEGVDSMTDFSQANCSINKFFEVYLIIFEVKSHIFNFFVAYEFTFFLSSLFMVQCALLVSAFFTTNSFWSKNHNARPKSSVIIFFVYL
jgi:hypothetical protein